MSFQIRSQQDDSFQSASVVAREKISRLIDKLIKEPCRVELSFDRAGSSTLVACVLKCSRHRNFVAHAQTQNPHDAVQDIVERLATQIRKDKNRDLNHRKTHEIDIRNNDKPLDLNWVDHLN